ncbi:CDP-alcohol phosphatidyltransferase family protein [Aestuariivirga sp. YIM B02566]|uniref:Phosphatidylcholine/phosphatidylserine synthase n=1 Tax=Taklimakanibacter albus TaxID=2800327 RepID=A0ACC5R9B0_9HYPH|nr:phosphatidylcholine/phosphatidylserine synthase [Aestuariivirga sp. YIM B02566]MBK1869233.1 phosphatidylcholine/phosphatidylserine synthase [Aestuariivirga sp. YIM B02566]
MRVLSRKLGKSEHDLRFILPNLFTAAALCAGMTALLLAAEGRPELAVLSVILAALFDACDGRIARLTGTASRFGAELDSLADVVSFGAAPAFILYNWGLGQFGIAGWLPCLALGTCCALRLARFNVMAHDASAPAWTANYFTGVPAPGGAFLALSPMLAEFAGLLDNGQASLVALFVTSAVAFLMISTWPTFSGKSLGRKASRLMLLPPVALVGLAAFGLLYWPWATLLVIALLYVATLPLSKWRHGVLRARSTG